MGKSEELERKARSGACGAGAGCAQKKKIKFHAFILPFFRAVDKGS
jgi:hypothetical protein